MATPFTADIVKAAENEESQDWFFHDIVEADFVSQHISTPMPDNVMVIDSRPEKPKFVDGHIPMAVSIPDTHFDKMTDKLPEDKNALLIFYCGGLKCKLTHKSARKAEALGYTNVKVFAKGFPGWLEVEGNYASVSPEWIGEKIAENKMVLVDSRPKRMKYDKGHVPSAISVPDSEFDELKGKLPADKDTLLVFYCGGFKCNLSHKSARKAIDLGYTNVRVFAEGYPGWLAYAGDNAGSALASAKPESGEEEGSIDIEYFKELVEKDPESVHLIDVRDADEFAKGSLKSAVNIPVDKLEDQVKSLPSDKPIVFICGTGARSGESFYMLQDLRPELKNVYYLDAEMTFGKDGTFTVAKPKTAS
jgi:rhodanese-related sulfurtransferase